MRYDLAIIGGGPAGVAAGVYASRKQLRTVFITDTFGGQSIDSADIQNWIGTPSISGFDLAVSLKKHLEAYAAGFVDIHESERVALVEKKDGSENAGQNSGQGSGQNAGQTYFLITTEKGATFEARTVLATAGSHRKKLTVPGGAQFEHKGITYCASCDGPMFSDQDVAVIGGGNAGFETAAQLLAYAKSVTLLQRSSEYRADPMTVEKVLSHPKMRGITGTEIVEIRGDKFANTLVYKDLATGESHDLPVTGIFVEIGHIPTTDFVKNLVTLDQFGHIIADPRNQRTSIDGIWAAGDCTDGLYHQNNIAAGDAVKALEDIYLYLHTK